MSSSSARLPLLLGALACACSVALPFASAQETSSAASSAESSVSSSAASAEDTGYASSAASSALPTGQGVITIDQKNNDNLAGKWSILKTDGTKIDGTAARQVITLPAGHYTFFVEAPKGTTAVLRMLRGKTELQNVRRPQITFVIADGDDLTLSANFPYTRVGDISVTSDPPGLFFTLLGPNGIKEEAVTPALFAHAAEGQYTVTYSPLDGCTAPPPKSDILQKDGRIAFTMLLKCAAADAVRAASKEAPAPEFVSATVGKNEIVFNDVPQDAWFAADVQKVTGWDILAGYTTSSGEPTGRFGPEDAVNIAQLSKIAHAVARLDERERAPSDAENRYVHGQWFAPFMLSAEARGWTIFQDPLLHPDKSATRAEVLVTLYQALDLPVRWQKGATFADVSARTPYAAAVEQAAADGIVSGKDGTQNADGKPAFGPGDGINRAEMAKILRLLVDKFRQPADDAKAQAQMREAAGKEFE